MVITSQSDRFVALYEDFGPAIYAYCRRRVGSGAADDAVSNTFLTAWKKIEEVPDGEKGLLWLYRVAYRAIGHHWRGLSRRKKLNTKLASLGATPVDPPEDQVIQNEEARMVLEAASQLRGLDYEVLRLAYWEHLPHAEIAEVVGLTTEAVTQRLYRARKALTQNINDIQGKNITPAAEKGGEA